ncbi:hypothetical protein J19TS2_04300 [Cohnella xylanilytica]|nr:flagellar biosynthesis protein FlhF [Cohnella xylanilytica]GIO10875.1 hypothetical protein J19TS2_04300 [Cohnella xylanilytica]
MKVKRYLVNDLPEAVQMIRNELGSDAVILNTKEIRIGGFLGMFRKKRVEVIAAVDESASKPKARPAAASSPRAASPAAAFASAAAAAVAVAPEPDPEAQAAWLPQAAVRERYSRGSGEGLAPSPKAAAAAKEILAGLSAQAGPAGEAPEPNAPAIASPRAAVAPSPGSEDFAGVLQAAAASPSRDRVLDGEVSRSAYGTSASPAAASPAETASRVPGVASAGEAEDETAALLQEIRSMKEMMLKMNRQQTFRAFPEPVMRLARLLARQGVEPAYVEQFAEAVSERLGGQHQPAEKETLEHAKEVLRAWLAPSAGTGISPSTRIVNFVGPTGVGKTTTIAKLAADQAFVHRRSVGFITADTYRIAAVDQLRTYADILNMPLEVVFSPSELNRAYKKLEDRDLLLMDTAGRNYRNELFVSEVNSLLAPGQQAESVLVLSLTHKYADMKQVAGHFSRYGVKRLLFTKMDETDSFGSVLNLVKEFDFEISYVTCGQTVPDDIRAFDPEELIGRLLEEPVHA